MKIRQQFTNLGWDAFVLFLLFALVVSIILLTKVLTKKIYNIEMEDVKKKPHFTETLAFIEKEFKVTAYCPCSKCCGRFADGITASGHILREGDKIVAAPIEIPFNTILNIPEYGIALVLDRGGAIKGNRLDVFFSTHEEALEWGVKTLKVKIYIQKKK